MDVNSKFWVRVDKSGDCWMWTKGCVSTGYGLFTITKHDRVLAHRYSWELHNGPIPDGLVVDHECHNNTECAGGKDCPHRKCVNPDHLALKTNDGNLAASHRYNGNKTHCPRGHEYTEANTRLQVKKNTTSRKCKACERLTGWSEERRLAQRERRAKQKENANGK